MRKVLLFLAGLAVMLTACLVPPFSEIQSARVLGPGGIELTPHYSSVFYSGEGETDRVQDNFGVQAGIGVIPFMDIRLRYEYLSAVTDSSEPFGASVLGFGPKFSLIKDRLAFFIPLGFAFGEDIETSETWKAYPTLLFTIPVNKGFELNTSAKALIPLSGQDEDTLFAFNLGAGISTDLKRWAIRPEFGLLFNPEGTGFDWHISCGFSFRFNLWKPRASLL